MRLLSSSICKPVFKAHSYEVEHKSNRVTIQTNNEKNLGNEPYLVYQTKYRELEEKMNKNNGLYSANIYSMKPDLKYHILYKDTGKIDLKDGKDYEIHPRKMIQQVAHNSRMIHRQPTVLGIKEGKVTGKVVYIDDGIGIFDELPEMKEPTIIVTPEFTHNADNPNLVGLIFTSNNGGALSHVMTQLRHKTDVCGAVFEPEIINKLISKNGRNIELEVYDGNISFNESEKTGHSMIYPRINVPKLKPCNKMLTSNEYSPDVIGAKAVNLHRLEELKKQGKIDVIIPKSIALTHGFIQQIFDENPVQKEYYNNPEYHFVCKEDAYIPYEEKYCKERIEGIKQELYKNGIVKSEQDRIMVRSAFNGEDLPNYSAAGIYQSKQSTLDNEWLYDTITRVARSKWDENAMFSREMHKIPEENIQIGILLQERVNPDYKFTLYTDDEKGNLRFDLYSNKEWRFEGITNPHTFTYNKNTGELTYDSIQLATPIGKFNENEEMQSLEPVEYDLSGNTKLFKQLKSVAENAIIVEKEFGHPQDIEGGIKGDNIYFWQTRNIVG